MQNVLEKLRWTTCFYTHPPYPLYKNNLFYIVSWEAGKYSWDLRGGAKKLELLTLVYFLVLPLGYRVICMVIFRGEILTGKFCILEIFGPGTGPGSAHRPPSIPSIL